MNKRSFLKGLFGGTIVTAASTVIPEKVEAKKEMSLAELQYKKDCEFLDNLITRPDESLKPFPYHNPEFELAAIAMMRLSDTDYIKYVQKAMKQPKLFLYLAQSKIMVYRTFELADKVDYIRKQTT